MYDNKKEDVFVVHLPHKLVRFIRDMNGLYLYKLPYIQQSKASIKKVQFDDEIQFLETVNENKLFYTRHQIDQAKRARELFYSLGSPSVNDMKAIIWMNVINNNPVTVEDIDTAERIYGRDVPTLKGKTTQKKPIPVVQDCINIPRELITSQYAITLCLDGMKVNGLTFLTMISKNIMYQTAWYIPWSTASIYCKAIQQVL
jgi:hypothetical protein